MMALFLGLFLGLFFALPAWANHCGFPWPDRVIIYQGTNRGDACQVLGPGNYTTSSSFGLPNDSISAIDVGSNVRAVLYKDANFSGRQAHYDGGWSYDPLGNVDNRTSSIEIFPMQGGSAATWYEGNYPSNSESFWANDAQGLANDGANWFVVDGFKASNTDIFKVPLSHDLASSSDAGLSTGIPQVLKNIGYDHFGDPDQSSGFLFVPVEDSDESLKPRIAVFSTVDLRFLSSFELSDSPTTGASWLAIRPGVEQTLWVSAFDLGEGNQIREYDIDWGALGVFGRLDLTFRRQITPSDRDGVTPLNLQSMQGGVFNPDGTLFYTSNGACDSNGYVYVFAIEDGTNTPTLQAQSENGYGPFNFETHPGTTTFSAPFYSRTVCSGDEAEGLDWLDVRGLNVPGIPYGQLHLVMIENDLTDSDEVYLKHYSL